MDLAFLLLNQRLEIRIMCNRSAWYVSVFPKHFPVWLFLQDDLTTILHVIEVDWSFVDHWCWYLIFSLTPEDRYGVWFFWMESISIVHFLSTEALLALLSHTSESYIGISIIWLTILGLRFSTFLRLFPFSDYFFRLVMSNFFFDIRFCRMHANWAHGLPVISIFLV